MIYKIFYGLGGGFGGARECEAYDCADKESAEELAHELACEEYERYDGMHGLRSVDDIMEEDELDEDEALEQYEEEREDWLDYRVELCDNKCEECDAEACSMRKVEA